MFAIADPDSAVEVNAVYVYSNCLEAGDVGVFIDYNIPYATPPLPTETATESYIAAFVDTDGATQLRAAAPFAYNDKGYNKGVAWIYFSAADAATYSLDVVDAGLYRIWLMGNPTIAWVGAPPKTIASIDAWSTAGIPAPLIAGKILYYAQSLETAWALDLIEVTSLGDRLTSGGENYFENVIAQLRLIAPGAFSAGTSSPLDVGLDYSTGFGATMTDVTGTVTGSPIPLVPGAQTVTVTVAGTFTLVLSKGTVGTVEDGTGTVTGSPVDIVAGTNTITVPGGGTGDLTVTVNLQNTQTGIDTTVVGTALDLTAAAAAFGMSRELFSGIVWLIISVLICAAVYGVAEKASGGAVIPFSGGGGAAKTAAFVFDLCIVGGGVLGLLPVLIAVLFFIGYSFLIGYVLFYRTGGF